MRIPEALISPKGAFVFTGLTAGFGFVAVALDQAENDHSTLFYAFSTLAGASFLVVLAALYEHYRRYLWVVGGPVAFGLLLGVTGWLIWGLLYGVFIGFAAWALMQAGFTVWVIGKSATTAKPSAKGRVTDEEWAKLPLAPVTDATFRDQPVPLDGYAYDRCTFVRCTFVYKGEKPFKLTNFKIEDDWNVETASPQLDYFSFLLNALEFIRKDIEVADEFQPKEPIAYGEVRRPAKQEQSNLRPDENRMKLRLMLRECYDKGKSVYWSEPSSEDSAEDWKDFRDELAEWDLSTAILIEHALGKPARTAYIEGVKYTADQSFIAKRLDRLKKVISDVDYAPMLPEVDASKYPENPC